jgi:two-component system, sensor histidine kinase SagS
LLLVGSVRASRATRAQSNERRKGALTEHTYSGSVENAIADGGPLSAATGQWEQGIRLEALANLAHELRSPVQALLGYIDILRDEMADDLSGKHRQIVDRMNVNIHDLSQTVENLLEFALADAQAEALVEDYFSVDDLMAEVSPALEAANEGKKLSIEVQIDDALGRLHLRSRPIKSILSNLAVNAIKFTTSGSVRISFKLISMPELPRALELSVTDTGPGIESALVELAFRRCIQLSNSSARRFRGMGLGLAVVKHNVDMLRATLTVTSLPNQGSTFVVTIPLSGAAVDSNSQLATPILLTNPVNGGAKNADSR